jgi:hypothetical protein
MQRSPILPRALIIIGALDGGERLVIDGSGKIDTADLSAERGARRNNLDRHWQFSAGNAALSPCKPATPLAA